MAAADRSKTAAADYTMADAAVGTGVRIGTAAGADDVTPRHSCTAVRQESTAGQLLTEEDAELYQAIETEDNYSL